MSDLRCNAPGAQTDGFRASPRSSTRLRALLLAATACGSTLALAAPARAQDNQLSEIIVTARKRQESILNVPVIETAIPREQLERVQIKDVRDVARFVPGLNFAQGISSAGVTISIRGIGTTALDPAIDQTVSLNIDGMQFSQGMAYQSAMFDLGQVEVLKGPQSLFYGKSSPGGVVSVRSADPTDKFEVIGRAGYEFEAREKRGELIVSGPVTDTVKARLAGMYSDQQGFFSNPAVALAGTGAMTPSHDRLFPTKTWVVRGTVLWNPTDRFSARLKGTLTHDRVLGTGSAAYKSCPDGTNPPAPGVPPFIGGGEDCKLDRTIRVVDMDPAFYPAVWNGGVGYLDAAQQYTTLEMNYKLRPDLTLTSQTGYYHVRTGSSFNAGTTTFAGPAFAVQTRFRREDFTQELRLNSDFAGPLNFTAGGFYQDANFEFTSSLAGNSLFRLPPLITNFISRIDIKTYSAYGQARWKVIPDVEVALGARYTDEKRDLTTTNLLTAVPTPVITAVPHLGSKTWSPELTVTYKPIDTLTIFGSLKQGYKSGSFNVGQSPAPGLDLSYGDEKVQGGEVGLKSRLLDRRLAVELAAYDYHYTGLQVGVSQPPPPGAPTAPITSVQNAGSARTYGVDFSLAYRPPQIEGLGLNLNGEWNHGRFKSLHGIPCWGGERVQDGCTELLNPNTGLFTGQNLSGIPLARAPDWQVNFGFEYERPVGYGMTLVVANTNNYTSRYLTFLGALPSFYQKGFMKNDLSVAIRGPEERWEVALIGNNLGNRLTSGACSSYNAAGASILAPPITGGTTRNATGTDEVACRLDRGREIWLRLTLRPFN